MKISVENITPFFKPFKNEIILALCALFLTHVIARAIKKARSNFPPGPTGWPIVGYLPFLTRDAHLDFIYLAKKYGDVFSLKLGSQEIVVLNGADTIIEAFNKPEFLGRPPNSIFQKVNPSSAFFGCNFNNWKEQRRPVVKFMKDLGLGKTKFERNIMDEINSFMEVLRKRETQPIDLRKILPSSISNNICSLIIGERLDYDDPKRQFLDENIKMMFDHCSHISLDVFFPWMRFIPFANKFLSSHTSKTAFEDHELFLQNEINEHLKTFNPAHVRDFIDRYLVEIDKERAKHTDSSFNQSMLISNARDMIAAATETIEVSLLWLVYTISAFPDVQKKVQKEIMEIIGPDKTPEYMDMKNMPYTRAVILEVMRWKCVAALNVVHYTLADTSVGRYNIQKGTTVLANFWAVHHDPRYWEEPDKFKPERFLSKDGNYIVKPTYFMPFSLGRRACPGESMAYLEIFLYITSILREFNVAFSDETEPTFNGKLCLAYRPEPYLVRFVPKTRYVFKEDRIKM